MTAAILVIIAACAVFWLVFFRLKLLRLTPGWDGRIINLQVRAWCPASTASAGSRP
jgi:hypothetical protein